MRIISDWLLFIEVSKISVKVDVEMEYSDKNKQDIINNEALINEHYKQPVQRQFQYNVLALISIFIFFIIYYIPIMRFIPIVLTTDMK